jgi:hypothetical protein
MLSPNRWNSSHTTAINAPISVVWDSLSDIHSWEWNQWVRLDAQVVSSGVAGKAKVSNGKKRRWRVKDFAFGEVARDNFTFSWTTDLGMCKCTNTMRLIPVGDKKALLTHIQTFHGVLPTLGLVLPFKKLKSYPFCMNEALKNHVESLHFNSLLMSLSTREMFRETTESTPLTDDPDNSKVSYWETPKHLRKELISCFIEDSVII